MSPRSGLYLLLLDRLRGVYDDGQRNRVDQYAHSLQVATRAANAGADTHWIVAALLHDVFRILAPATHGEAVAEALADRLPNNSCLVLATHGIWQHDVVHGTALAPMMYGRAPWYGDACRFAEWDAASFDPGFVTHPLTQFVPLVREILD